MSTTPDEAPLSIPTMTYEHRQVMICPRGGGKNLRVKTRSITLPRISILSDEVAQFLASPIVPAQPTNRRARSRRRSR
ncbi:MAG: hypothetical protein B7Y80_13660 [Hyphomicrobium sp. 32-62-53]|nr:MAG: hypothetical protein B7Y80_13660 [Hyphomicrobium sp. 32-62-53]